MKYKKFPDRCFSTSIWTHSINLIEAFSTGISSVSAVFCLVVLDGWVLKLSGVVGWFGVICLIIYLSDILKEKVRLRRKQKKHLCKRVRENNELQDKQ